jgi:hypothetical protein
VTERRQDGFEAWVNRNHIEARLVVSIALVMLWWVTRWSFEFSSSSKFDGTGTAAVIAAVQVPATFFIKWAFETWKDIIK